MLTRNSYESENVIIYNKMLLKIICFLNWQLSMIGNLKTFTYYTIQKILTSDCDSKIAFCSVPGPVFSRIENKSHPDIKPPRRDDGRYDCDDHRFFAVIMGVRIWPFHQSISLVFLSIDDDIFWTLDYGRLRICYLRKDNYSI